MDRCGPEPARHLQALGDRVDREHLRRARGPGGLDGTQPDGAETEHRGGVAGAQPGVGERVIAGAEHVAREQRDIVGHAVGHTPSVRFARGTSTRSAWAPCRSPSFEP